MALPGQLFMNMAPVPTDEGILLSLSLSLVRDGHTCYLTARELWRLQALQNSKLEWSRSRVAHP